MCAVPHHAHVTFRLWCYTIADADCRGTSHTGQFARTTKSFLAGCALPAQRSFVPRQSLVPLLHDYSFVAAKILRQISTESIYRRNMFAPEPGASSIEYCRLWTRRCAGCSIAQVVFYVHEHDGVCLPRVTCILASISPTVCSYPHLAVRRVSGAIGTSFLHQQKLLDLYHRPTIRAGTSCSIAQLKVQRP